MERLYQRYRDRGFTILALSVDRNVAAIPGFVEGFRLTFPIGLDPEAIGAKAYRMRALPTTVVIARAGQVVAGAAGARDWDSPAAHAVVETLLRRAGAGRARRARSAGGECRAARSSSGPGSTDGHAGGSRDRSCMPARSVPGTDGAAIVNAGREAGEASWGRSWRPGRAANRR
jgi:AhpC/TSA family